MFRKPEKNLPKVTYYVYISDAKVDMLLPQIPHKVKKQIATELKVDLKLLSASWKEEVSTEENRVTRLNAVLTFLRQFGNVGTIESATRACRRHFGNALEANHAEWDSFADLF